MGRVVLEMSGQGLARRSPGCETQSRKLATWLRNETKTAQTHSPLTLPVSHSSVDEIAAALLSRDAKAPLGMALTMSVVEGLLLMYGMEMTLLIVIEEPSEAPPFASFVFMYAPRALHEAAGSVENLAPARGGVRAYGAGAAALGEMMAGAAVDSLMIDAYTRAVRMR